MTPGRNRSATGFGGAPRAAIPVLALCLLVTAFSAPVSASDPVDPGDRGSIDASSPLQLQDRIGLRLRLGFSEFQPIKDGFWYPLWAELSAVDFDLRGELIVRHGDTPLRVRIPVDVAAGSTKRYLSWYRITDSSTAPPEIFCDARLEGVTMTGLKFPFRRTSETDRHVLVLTDEPGTFSWLNRRIDSPDSQFLAAMSDRAVIYCDPEFLPDRPVGYESLDSIILSGSLVRRIREPQWEAIRTWVRGGGRLLLFGGHYQRFIEASALGEPFGLEIRPAVETPLGTDTGAVNFLLALPAGLQDGDRIRLGTADEPLLVTRPAGRGFFSYSAAAPDEPWVAYIDERLDARYIWPDLLEGRDSGGDAVHSARSNSGSIGFLLQEPFVISIAGMGWLSAYLGLYLLLVVPVNWFVCRRAGRREWAWPVAVMLALMFSAFGFMSSSRGGDSRVIVSELSVMTRPSASDPARVLTSSVVFTPRRFSQTFASSEVAWPAYQTANHFNPYYYGGQSEDLYANEPFDVDFSEGAALRDFFIHPWSARNLTTDELRRIDGGIEQIDPVRLSANRDELVAGVLRNTSPMTFEHWWIRGPLRSWKGAHPLAPGAGTPVAGCSAAGYSTLSEVFSLALARNKDAIRAMAAAEGKSGSGNDYYYEQSNLAQIIGRDDPPSGNLLRFVGIADGPGSPLLGDAGDFRHVGTVIYEQDLALAPEMPGEASSDAPRFTLQFFDEQTRRRATVYWAQVDEEPNRLTFQNGTVAFRAVPSRRIEPQAGDRIELALSFRAEPLEQRVRNRTSQGMERWYEPVGCPLRVYNFRTFAFEELDEWDGSPIGLFPASDYLHPVSSEIALSLDAESSALRYAEVNLQTGEPLDAPLVDVGILNQRGFYHYGHNYLSLGLTSVIVSDAPPAPSGVHPLPKGSKP